MSVFEQIFDFRLAKFGFFVQNLFFKILKIFKNLTNFVPINLKLYNQCYHNVQHHNFQVKYRDRCALLSLDHFDKTTNCKKTTLEI